MSRRKKAAPKRKLAVTKKNRTPKAVSTKSTSAGKSRAEGIRLFALAGRPSKEDFVKVYGPAGPKMTLGAAGGSRRASREVPSSTRFGNAAGEVNAPAAVFTQSALRHEP